MNDVIDLPAAIAAKQVNQNLHLRGSTGTAGKGTSNREQIIVSENRIWRAQIDLATLADDLRLPARVLAADLNGRVNILRIPVNNRGTQIVSGTKAEFLNELGVTQSAQDEGFLRYSAATAFSDNTGFALPSADEPVITGAAAIGATQLGLENYLGRNAVPGARFSINGFLYQIQSNDDGQVTIVPPLREAVAEGDRVELSAPKVLMRLTSDDGYEPFERFGRFVAPAARRRCGYTWGSFKTRSGFARARCRSQTYRMDICGHRAAGCWLECRRSRRPTMSWPRIATMCWGSPTDLRTRTTGALRSWTRCVTFQTIRDSPTAFRCTCSISVCQPDTRS